MPATRHTTPPPHPAPAPPAPAQPPTRTATALPMSPQASRPLPSPTETAPVRARLSPRLGVRVSAWGWCWLVACWSQLLRAQARLDEARRGAHDRGSQTTDYLLIAGIVAATALAVGAIIGPKLIAKARSFTLGG